MKIITVSELGEVVTGHTPPTSKREYYGDYIPFIKPTDISVDSKYTYEPEEYYSQLGFEKYKKSLIPRGATCVVCIGTLGEKMTMSACDCFTNQSINTIIPNENYDNEYVYYLLKYNLHRVKARNRGTASGREFVSKSSFLEMELEVHENINTQKRIGEILSSYDDLIENNQKQIKLLEEAAQRLYKEWFVDLRFPGHETTPIADGIPKGWYMAKLSDVADVNGESISKQYPYDYVDYVDLGSVSKGHIEAVTRFSVQEAPGRAKRIASDGDIIWGMVRPNLKSYALVFHPSETSVFSTGFAVLHAKSVPFSFLYCYVTQDDFVGYLVNCTNGAAYPAVKPVHFEEAIITIPSDDLLCQFHLIAEPMYRKIEALENQIQQAIEARDRLLPKLMNGESEV